MRTASTPRTAPCETRVARRRCATRFRSSGSVRSRTPSRSTWTVAWPTYSIRAKREALHAVSEALRLRQRLELLERVVLDLADALARDAEGLADLLERARLRTVEAVAKLDDPPLALGKSRQRDLDVLAPKREGGSVEGRLRGLV